MAASNFIIDVQQVQVIENREQSFSEVRETLRYLETVDTSGLLDLITRRDALAMLSGSATLKTQLIVATDFTINWQTDIITGDGRTFAQKHGNTIGVIAGVSDSGGGIFTSYVPGYNYTEVAGLITTLNITEVFAGKITII